MCTDTTEHGAATMLENAIAQLDIGADADRLRHALACLDRLSAKVSSAIGEFAAAGGHTAEHATSMTAWLCTHARLHRPHAHHLVKTATVLHDLPLTRQAWEAGTISTGHTQAILANLRPHTVAAYAAREERLLAVIAPLPVRQAAHAMAQWRIATEAVLDDEPAPEPTNAVHLSRLLDDQWRLDATLNAETGALLDKALGLERDAQFRAGDTRPLAQRNADALAAVCRFYLDNQTTRPGGRHRPHFNIILDAEHLTDHRGARLWDGTALDPTATGRLLCDATIHRVLKAGSTILDYGRATRTVPAPLWAALVIRDQHCRFPGCDRPPNWCEGHHLQPWEDEGPTNLANLALLCSRHHHLLHKPGWHAHLDQDDTLHVTAPDGTRHTTRPPAQLTLAA